MNEIIVNHIKVVNLKPTKKNFINKNKKFSATGYYKNTKVKIYEVFDQNQGNLRAFVSKNKNLSSYFPKLIGFDKKYIIEEWVDGKTLNEINAKNLEKKSQSKEVKKIIKLLWDTKYDMKVFDYIEHIHKRVNKKNIFDLSNIPNRINHNDLSYDNIIMTSEGIKIIDNEFLGCNSGWILNVRNSFLEKDFEYQRFVSENILDNLWDIRKEWSKSTKKNKFNNIYNLYKTLKKIL